MDKLGCGEDEAKWRRLSGKEKLILGAIYDGMKKRT